MVLLKDIWLGFEVVDVILFIWVVIVLVGMLVIVGVGIMVLDVCLGFLYVVRINKRIG